MNEISHLPIAEAIISWKKTGNPALLHQLLGQYNFADPHKAVKNIMSMAEDDLALAEFLDVVPVLLSTISQLANPDMALNNWERFARAVFDRRELYELVGSSINVLRFFNRIFSSSQFLSDILIRNPEYFGWLIEENFLAVEKNRLQLVEEFKRAIAIFREPKSRRNCLCRLRRRELLRIGARDLMELTSVESITRELSALAEAVLEIALNEAEQVVLKQFGEPQILVNDNSKKSEFIIVAMGKLGAGELNFSSDIDFIFVYEDEGETTGIAPDGSLVKKVSNHHYFTYLGREIIRFLSEHTEEGMLYRCDVRLRPECGAGPLVRSFDSYANYFFSQARYWECIAYLKARPVAGSEKLGKSFRRLVEEFIFQPRDPTNFKAEIFALKERIDYEVQQKNLTLRDVKRGRGGIREIEFLISTLQLMFTKEFPQLNTVSTFGAIQELAKLKLLSPAEAQLLLEAYKFLRIVEHRLQIAWEAKTHLLPEAPGELMKLAYRLGYNGPDATTQFLQYYQHLTQAVHNIFCNFFQPATDRELSKEFSNVLLILAPDTTAEAVMPVLRQYRLSDVNSVKYFRELFSGTREIYVSTTGQRFVETLLPQVLEICKTLPHPDLAIRHLLNFVSAIKAPTAFFEFVASQADKLKILLRLFGTSEFFSHILISHPEFFEPLIINVKEVSETFLLNPEREFDNFFATIKTDEPFYKLRLFKQYWTLLTATTDLNFGEQLTVLPQILTKLAEFCLQRVYSATLAQLAQKYGISAINTDPPCAELLIFAVGGFGGNELSYFSDLDLLFVMSDEEISTRIQTLDPRVFFTRVAEAIIQEMSAITPAGTLFNVDTRLRPEGVSGELVSTADRFVKYYTEAAQLWELQSFLKARHIVGDRLKAQRVQQHINTIIQQRIRELPPSKLNEHILDMRQRLEQSVAKIPDWAAADFKRGPGGLVDIEFAVQFLQLRHCPAHPELFIPETTEALKKLAELNLIASEDASELLQNYRFLRLLESRQRLLMGKTTNLFPADKIKLERLAYSLPPPHFTSPEALSEKFFTVNNSNRQIFSRILECK